MMELSFEQAITLLERLTVIVALFLVYKSVPSDKVSELLQSAKKLAEQTESELDDTAVSVAERLFEFFKKKQEAVKDTQPTPDTEADTVQLKKSSEI